MLISLDSGELNKAISAMNSLYALDKWERVGPREIYKLIKEFLSKYSNMAEYQIKYFKDKIYGLFDIFTRKDGINPDMWDLYAFFIESLEINVDKLTNKDNKEINKETTNNDIIITKENETRSDKYYKQIVDIRLKQCRSLTIPEWDKDDKQVELLLKALSKLEKDLEKIEDKSFLEDKKIYLVTSREKIDKIRKKKELEQKLFAGK